MMPLQILLLMNAIILHRQEIMIKYLMRIIPIFLILVMENVIALAHDAKEEREEELLRKQLGDIA